ncbi:MAG: NusG domain II-containing protein [Clostridia bacterium]|nr:NusG domain II-containing protein [Clostridia bacterium]
MKKKDFILIGVIVALALVLLICVKLTQKEGACVVVKIDGIEVATYSLNVNGTYTLNGGTNVLIIKDGFAYLSEANCPDHLCVKQGKISKTGQVITCLPNKLTVTVYGAEKNDVDLIS